MTQTQNINQFSNNTGVWGHSLFTLWPVYTMIDVKPTVSERHLQTSTYQCSELLWTRPSWAPHQEGDEQGEIDEEHQADQ